MKPKLGFYISHTLKCNKRMIIWGLPCEFKKNAFPHCICVFLTITFVFLKMGIVTPQYF